MMFCIHTVIMADILPSGWAFYGLMFFLVSIIFGVISQRKKQETYKIENISRASIYKLGQKGYVLHANRKAKSGFFLAGDPYIKIPESASVMDIVNAIRSCLIFDDSERVPDSGRKVWDKLGNVYVQKMGLKSLKELHNSTVKHCSLMVKDDMLYFIPWDHAEALKDGFVPTKTGPLIISYNVSGEEILNGLEVAFSKCDFNHNT